MQRVDSNNIFIGDLQAAQDEKALRNEEIKSVCALGISFDDYNKISDIKYKFYEIDDNPKAQIPFEEIYSWIEEADKPVLIHCDLGMSRAPAVVVYYTMKKKEMTFNEALLCISRLRPIQLNTGFEQQLKNAEIEIQWQRYGCWGLIGNITKALKDKFWQMLMWKVEKEKQQ